MKLDVQLTAFSGATTDDTHSYLKPLLMKEPTTVVLHIGTNNATENCPMRGLRATFLPAMLSDVAHAEVEADRNYMVFIWIAREKVNILF